MPLLTPALGQRVKFGRTIEGCSAVLLPLLPDYSIDEVSFRNLLQRTFTAGLAPAVNMDTGYVNLLQAEDRKRVLEITKDVAQGRRFIAGAFIQAQAGDPVTLYKQQIEWITAAGGVPIIFPCDGIKSLDRPNLVKVYQEIGKATPEFLGFELGEMFVPFGRIFDMDTVKDLMQIPSHKGMKHSSLERELELERLALRDSERPDFKVYTGNDLAVDLVMYGSDYLLGLSAFYPEAFALRDALWKHQDVGFYQLNDLIQYLGFLAFRAPVPSYKHNAAQFLHLRGLTKTNLTHPKGISRPDSDVAILENILTRLDTMVAQYKSRIPA